MRRVLVVSPHFPPVNAPDMQRARLALPYLRELGWEPVVLAVEPTGVEGAVLDPLLEQTYPADIRVVRVRAIPHRITRKFGFGSLWLRSAAALRRAGDELLSAGGFDLVFFTNTQFDSFTLGPRWQALHRVPYVLDYQDPWVNDYYRRAGVRPPGGRLKYLFSQYTAARREPRAVRGASAIVSVSASYGPDLLARYPDIPADRIHHLPFGAAPADLLLARRHRPAQDLIPFGDGRIHLVYAGRCGPDMSGSLALLFRAFARYRNTHPREAARLHFHFVGTDYAPPPLGKFWALPVADQEGVSDAVSEYCYRVPYFDALSYLARADGLLAVGSNDPTYSASKIFPYLLARRPLLTIVHADSLMLELVREQRMPASYGFGNEPSPADFDALVERIYAEWFVAQGWLTPPTGDLALLNRHTAEGMSRRLAAIFDSADSTGARA